MASTTSGGGRSTITHHPTFLTLPEDVRAQVYDQLLPLGVTIRLRVNTAQTLLPHLYSIARSCRTIKHEIDEYLAEKPWIIYTSHGQVLTILHGIPDRILSRISVLVIEDEPAESQNWALLKNLRYICFTDVYESKIYAAAKENTFGASVSTLAVSNSITTMPTGHSTTSSSSSSISLVAPIPVIDSDIDLLTPIPPPVTLSYPMPPLSHLPPTNIVLRDAHTYWKRLRLSHCWIRELQNPDHPTGGNLRVVLRRVSEAEVIFDPPEASSAAAATATATASPVTCPPTKSTQEPASTKRVVGWHSVVDVHTRRLVETGWLPERVERLEGLLSSSVERQHRNGSESESESESTAGGGSHVDDEIVAVGDRHPAPTATTTATTTTAAAATTRQTKRPQQDEYVFPYGVMYSWWRSSR